MPVGSEIVRTPPRFVPLGWMLPILNGFSYSSVSGAAAVESGKLLVGGFLSVLDCVRSIAKYTFSGQAHHLLVNSSSKSTTHSLTL